MFDIDRQHQQKVIGQMSLELVVATRPRCTSPPASSFVAVRVGLNMKNETTIQISKDHEPGFIWFLCFHVNTGGFDPGPSEQYPKPFAIPEPTGSFTTRFKTIWSMSP